MAVKEVDDGLPVVRAAELSVQLPEAQWLVRDIWGLAAVGILGGPPKSCKSWMGLELATSVAAGTPCLGRFEVENPGPSLVYLAEDSLPMVRARLQCICEARGLCLSKLDVHVVTAPLLRLDLEKDQRRLRATVKRLRPRLLVLDPLVRMHALNENDAREISGLLGYLRALQREHEVAIAVVHHARKRSASSPGQALRGSSDIYAWTDVTAHLGKTQDGSLLLQVEHRSAPSPAPSRLRLTSRADGTGTHLKILGGREANETRPETTAQRVLDTLRQRTGPCSAAALREDLRLKKSRVLDALHDLERQGLVDHLGHKKGWTLKEAGPAV